MINFDNYGKWPKLNFLILNKLNQVEVININPDQLNSQNTNLQRDKFGRFINGFVPWNKGKKGVYSDEVLRKWSESKKGKRISPKTEFKKGHRWFGEIEKKRLDSSRKKILISPNLNMNEDLAYVLGVLKGDGSVFGENGSYRIVLDVTDKKFAMGFFNSLKNIGLNPSIKGREPAFTNIQGKLKKYRVRATSKVFGEWYNNLLLDDIRKLLKDREDIISFIRGFYEAEGCAYIYKGRYRVASIYLFNTNVQLIKLFKNLCENLDVHFNLTGPYRNDRQFKNSKPIYRLGKSVKKEVYRFMEIINPCIKNIRGDIDV